MRRTAGIPHLPELDGLRAVAVVAVVAFHLRGDLVPGGFIGVDIFFVISGYLITSILVREHESTGRIGLVAFWTRRSLRLAPALALVVSVCALAAVATGQGTKLGLADSIGALTWTQNWVHLWASATTWGFFAPTTFLDHLWSLAIEEQFYLVWPLVLLALRRWVPSRRGQLAGVAVMFAASATVMGVIDHGAAYFRTDARAFELLGGAALAISGLRPRPVVAHVGAALGLAAVLVFAVMGSPVDEWLYPWGFLAATAVSVTLVAATTVPPLWLTKVLGGRSQAIGRVSYGIYLWHVPVIRLLTPERVGVDGAVLDVVRLAVLAVVVQSSYRLVERPVRTGRWRPTPARLAIVGLLVVASLVPLMVEVL